MKCGVWILVAGLLVQGCSYAISPGVVQQADRAISFAELESHPEFYVGKLVILGGTIEGIQNTPQGAVLTITQKKLDHWGKPLPSGWSSGSFTVVQAGFLDPLVYAPGRDITVAGSVQGNRPQGLDDTNIIAPVLLARELKLWPRERPSWNRPQYLDPLYDPRTSPRQ